jgi:competence protein ComGC
MIYGKHRGLAIITMVISLLIAAIIIYAALTIYKTGKSDQGITSPIDKGKRIQCVAQIRRIEIEIKMYLVEHSRYPSDLSELEGLSEEDFYCPETHNPYKYDPGTGRVTCPDHTK